jgi:hypothetical protein
MKDPLFKLLESLEEIGILNEEIYDSECREKMLEYIWNKFIRPINNYQPSDDFGLYSADANRAVKNAMYNYVVAALGIAKHKKMNFLQRLATFQNSGISTPVEGSRFDDFFGWVNPERYNYLGEWLEDISGAEVKDKDKDKESNDCSKNRKSDSSNKNEEKSVIKTCKQLNLFDGSVPDVLVN